MPLVMPAMVSLALVCAASAADTGVVEKVESRPITVALQGVPPGGWTMDFDTARALAASNDTPLFVSFTGSDWCQYCRQVEREVFALPEWQAFASNRFILVNIDLPRNPDLLPAAIRDRNESLQNAFEVEGFPTFLVIEKDGRTVLKRFGMARDLNPTNFIREAAVSLRRRPAEVRRFLAGLPPGQSIAYTNMLSRVDQLEREAQAWLQTRPEKSAANMRKLQEFVNQNATLSGALDDFEAEKILGDLSGEGREQAVVQLRLARDQVAVLVELQAAKSAMDDWLLGRPADTPANRARLAEMMKRVSAIQARMK